MYDEQTQREIKERDYINRLAWNVFPTIALKKSAAIKREADIDRITLRIVNELNSLLKDKPVDYAHLSCLKYPEIRERVSKDFDTIYNEEKS